MSKGDATRERILSKALQIASLDGLEGLSIGRLADEVGMSKSGLFAHFGSKEELQLEVLSAAAAKFADVVLRPALTVPRGAARVRALFERWLAWEQHESVPGGCVFMHLSVELDDRPGPTRDALVATQRQWLESIARTVRGAMEAGDYRADVDPELFAFQLYGTLSSYYNAKRLLGDPQAEARARRAFEQLSDSARRVQAQS